MTKPTAATTNLFLTLVAIAAATALFLGQRHQISSLEAKFSKVEAQLEQNRTLLVSNGLQIVNTNGVTVAQFKAVENGSTLWMESFSDEGHVTSSLSLSAGLETGLTIGQVAVPATSIDNFHWANYGSSGFYAQSGLGSDRKTPHFTAKIGIDGDSAYESVSDEHAKLESKTVAGDEEVYQYMTASDRASALIVLSDGVARKGDSGEVVPASFHIGAATNGQTKRSWINLDIAPESVPNAQTELFVAGWDGKESATVSTARLALENRLGFFGFLASSRSGDDVHASLAMDNRTIIP